MINFSNCLFVSSVFCLLVCTYSCEKTDTRSNTKEITSISIPNVSSKIHKKNDTIIISVGKEVDASNLTPIIEISPYSTISPRSGTNGDFTNSVAYTVTAENGSNRIYVVEVQKDAFSEENDILSCTLPNVAHLIARDGNSIAIRVPEHTNISSIAPLFELSPLATISPKSGSAQNFSQPVKYVVTAENGSTATFTVTVNQTLSLSGGILSFQLQNTDQNVDIQGNNIRVYTPSDTDLSAIKTTVTIFPFDATIYPQSGEAVDLNTPKTFTVTSPDGKQENYLVTVIKSPWRCLLKNGEAPFKKVDGHQTVVFKDRIYLLGGWLGSNNPIDPNADIFSQEVWSTENGVDWTNMGDAPWAGRHGFGCVVFKEKLWVFAGDGRLDMWNTSDGMIWTEVTDVLPFSTRYFPYVAVLNDKIVLLHGQQLYDGTNVSLFTDVWTSSDGVDWQQITSVTAPVGRALICGNVVLNDQLYLIGGGVLSVAGVRAMEYNDVWKSSNGTQWYSVIKQAPFKPIYWH